MCVFVYSDCVRVCVCAQQRKTASRAGAGWNTSLGRAATARPAPGLATLAPCTLSDFSQAVTAFVDFRRQSELMLVGFRYQSSCLPQLRSVARSYRLLKKNTVRNGNASFLQRKAWIMLGARYVHQISTLDMAGQTTCSGISRHFVMSSSSLSVEYFQYGVTCTCNTN